MTTKRLKVCKNPQRRACLMRVVTRPPRRFGESSAALCLSLKVLRESRQLFFLPISIHPIGNLISSTFYWSNQAPWQLSFSPLFLFSFLQTGEAYTLQSSTPDNDGGQKMCWCCRSSNSSVSCDLSLRAISDYHSARCRVSLQLFELLVRAEGIDSRLPKTSTQWASLQQCVHT